jgi:hypothetical protein
MKFKLKLTNWDWYWIIITVVYILWRAIVLLKRTH